MILLGIIRGSRGERWEVPSESGVVVIDEEADL